MLVANTGDAGMKKLVMGIAALSALAVSGTAEAAVVINFSESQTIPDSNNFKSDLNGLGLTNVTATDASLILTVPSTLTFEFLASESGFNDKFSAAGISSFTEFTSFVNLFGSPMALGSAPFNAGSLANLLSFSSVGGANGTVGQVPFGIFLARGQTSGQSFSTFYIGYDDQIYSPDRDYDDMIIRVTATPAVPEASTWAMMLLGFGAVGFGLRRRKYAAGGSLRLA